MTKESCEQARINKEMIKHLQEQMKYSPEEIANIKIEMKEILLILGHIQEKLDVYMTMKKVQEEMMNNELEM